MAPGPWQWPSEKAIEKILTATGEDIVPPGLKVDTLRDDLHECHWQLRLKQAGSAGYRKSYKRQARDVVEHVNELKRLIGPYVNGLFYQQLRDKLDPGDYDAVVESLIRIKNVANIVLSETDSKAAGGTKDYLVQLLIPIYRKHFKREPGRSHDSSGPFPRFVAAVSKEMGRSLRTSRHTVHKALAKKQGLVKTVSR